MGSFHDRNFFDLYDNHEKNDNHFEQSLILSNEILREKDLKLNYQHT